MNRLCRISLPRFRTGLPAGLLAVALCCCAGEITRSWGQPPADVPSRPGAPPVSDTPAPRPTPLERADLPSEARPVKPDVYFLRDKDGKLVPVPDFSYEDFKRLYDLDRELADAAAPPKYVLSQLNITGEVTNDQAVLQVQLRVVTKSSGWTSIPLRFAGAILRDQPRYDGPGSILVEYQRERDGYVVWLQESDSQPHRLTFEAVIPVRRNGGSRRLAFSAPTAAVSDMKLKVPGTRISATVSEGAGLLSSGAVDSQTSELHIAGVGGDFQLNWIDAPTDTSMIPATLEASAAILVRVEGPRRLTSEGRVKVRSYGVPLTAFRVKLPPGLEWFPTTEPGYRVNLVETLREEGRPPTQVVEVSLDAKNSFLAEVRLRAVSPARETPTEERVETLGFDVLGAVRQFGAADFVIEGDWAVTWPQRENVQQVEVPDSLRQQKVTARFEYFRQPCSLAVLVQPRKTRISLVPEYTLRVGPRTMRLEAVLRFRVRGPSPDRVQIDLAGWKLEELQPESLVDADLMREGPDSFLNLPLVNSPSGGAQEFELRLEASRRTLPADDLLTVPLPRPRADTLAPARLTVIPAENVSLSPRLRDMPGGVAPLVNEASVAGGTSPMPLTFQLRGDLEQPRFVAGYQLRDRQLTVAIDHQVRVESRRVLVEQRYTCRVAFEPLRQFQVQVPTPIAESGFQASLEQSTGDLDALPVAEVLPQVVGGADTARLYLIDLGQDRLGTFVLVVRYAYPWSFAAEEAGTTLVKVPLLLPAADAATRLSAHRAHLVRDPQWQTDVADASWVPGLRAQEDSSDITLAATGWSDALPLQITPARSLANLGTIVRQAWVQSWYGRQWRQDRVVLRVQSSDRRLLVNLPPDIARDDLLVAVDGRRVRPSITTDGQLMRIDWDAAASAREQTVELSYLAPRGSDRYGRLLVTLPSVVGARGEQRWLWQLVLPPDEHLLVPPPGWVAQRRWLWQTGFLDRRMNGTQGDLERALQASAQVEPPGEANQYLFSSFAPEASLRVQVVDRTVLVLIASGVALLAGLLAIYFPLLRHPAMLWMLAIAGGALAIVAPSFAALALQASTLGIALAISGFVLRRLVRRRQGTRSVVRGTAVSVSEKPLSDFRTGRSDSKVQATTATVPPLVGLLAGLILSSASLSSAAGQSAVPSVSPPPPPAGTPKVETPTTPNPTIPNPAAKSGAARVEPRGETRLPPFRRVLVREEQIAERAKGHLPLAREEFERLLRTVQQQMPEGAPVTRIESADFIARWSAPGVVDGEARLRVVTASSQASVLSLAPCDLPILDPRWTPASTGESPAPLSPSPADRAGAIPPAVRAEPARLGLSESWGLCAIVADRGELRWRFTLQETSDNGGNNRFRARLPRGARQRWWIELPDPLVPQVTEGVVVGPGAETLIRDPPTGLLPSAGRAWWCLELGGRTDVEWLARSPAASEPWTPAFAWRQETQYDLGLQGIEWRTTLRLDVLGKPLKFLACDVPEDTRIAAVRLGDVALPWSMRSGTLEGRAELLIELPELQGTDRVLAVTAFSPPVHAAPHVLPRLRCRGGFWQEGNATLTVFEPLQLQSLNVRGGIQTHVTPLAAPQPAVSRGVQFHDEESALQVQVAVPSPQLRVLAGTTVNVDASTIQARAEATVSVLRGRPLEFAAEVSRAWSVDSVEVTPQSLLEDFSWEPAERPEFQRLVLRLRNPLAKDRPLRLAVHAHRPRSVDQDGITVDTLRVLEFPKGGGGAGAAIVEARRIVALRSSPDTPLRFRGAPHLVWLKPDQLAGPEAELLDPDADYLFVDGREATTLRGSLDSVPAAYTAEVAVEVLTSPGKLMERYRVECVPRGAPVSRLIVLFSHARGTPLTWHVDEDDVSVPAARRLSDRELAAVTRAAGEGWEVVLGAPRARPFRLWAERTTPWSERRPLSLVSLPESESQQGLLRLESRDAPPFVSHQGLEAIPVEPPGLNKSGHWLAAFRYAPANAPTVTITPPLRDVPTTKAWAWTVEHVTHHLESGQRVHRVRWWLENDGERQVHVSLPLDAAEIQLTVDSIPRSSANERKDNRLLLTVPLPSSQRHVELELTFRTPHPPLRWAQDLRPVEVNLDVPVLARKWLACVPASYRACRVAAAANGSPQTIDEWFSSVGSRLFALLDSAPADSMARSSTSLERASSSSKIQPALPRSQWQHAALSADSAEKLRSRDTEESRESLDAYMLWNQYAVVSSDQVAPLRILNADLVLGFSWTLLLFVAGAVAWPGTGMLRWIPLLATLLVASVPWMPGAWDPLPSGLFLGLVLGASILLVRRVHRADPARLAAEKSTRRLAVGSALSASLLVLTLAGHAPRSGSHAQESTTRPTAPTSIHEVLYPVDEEGRPVDDYIHVPQAFYQELRRRARGRADSLPGWLWQSAQYRMVVRDVPPITGENSPGWEVSTASATWELDVLAPNQRVTLPANAGWQSLLNQRLQREGQELDVPLVRNGETWSVTLEQPGRYQLEVTWRPSLRQRTTNEGTATSQAFPLGERWGLSQPIPRIPDSRLVIEFPDGQRWLEVGGARGAVTRDAPGRELRVELGPVDVLSVEGVVGAADANPALPVDVDQRYWFHLRPGSVTFEAQWTFSSAQGALPRLARVSLDPRLRLLPPSPNQPIERVTSPDTVAGWLQWEWSDEVVSSGTVRFSFLVAGASGIGQWRIPRMEPWNARRGQTYLAISSAPPLETQRTGITSLVPVPISEFLDGWGEASSPPQSAYRLTTDDQAWSLVTRVRDPRLLASQTTEVSLDLGTSRLYWAADVEISEGTIWSHALMVPEQLVIHDVTLIDRAREENRVLQWSRVEPGRVQIQLNAPLDGPHRLTLLGEFRTPTGELWSFPPLNLENIPLASQRCVIFREPAIDVAWESPPPVGARSEPTSDYRPGWGRKFAEWSPPGPENGVQTDAVALRVRENRPRVRVRLGTLLAAEGDEFRGELSGELSVESGVLDALRIETPADWPEELDIQPRCDYSWSRIPGESRKVLLLRPRQPWSGQSKFHVRGPALAALAERLNVPEARVPDADFAEYYLWLPSRVANRPLAWETSGLQATRWPEELPFLDSKVTPENGTAYRVVGSRMRVAMRDAQTLGGAPQVLLAEHRVLLDDEGSGWGVSLLDIESAGLADCVLELPISCELVYLRRDGRQVRRQALGPRQWRVDLAPAGWAQRLEVVYRITRKNADQMDGERILPLATIVDWPVSHSLVTAHAIGNVDPGAAALPSLAQAPLIQDLARLKVWSLGAEHAANALFSHPLRDTTHWWPTWQARFRRVDKDFTSRVSQMGQPLEQAETEREAARQRWQQASARLRIPESLIPSEDATNGPEPVDLDEYAVSFARLRDHTPVAWTDARWSAPQSIEPLVIRRQPVRARGGGVVFLWTLAWLAAGLTWLCLTRQVRTGQTWARWPQLILVCVGLGWWVMGPSPYFGLALVVLGVLATLRGDWGYRLVTKTR